MQCDKVWDLLSVYADGEATPQEAAIVEAHVAACPDCARDLQFMLGAHDVLKDAPEVEPPATLRSAILAATVNRPSLPQRLAIGIRKTLSPAPVRYGVLAAAGAAAALTAVVLHEGNEPGTIIPSEPSVVATVPAAPDTSAVLRSIPDVDLLEPYETKPAAQGQVRTAKAASSRRPVRMARSEQSMSRRHSRVPAAGTHAKDAGEAAGAVSVPGSDVLHGSPTDGASSTASSSPDPEPVTKLVAASGGAASESVQPSESVGEAARSAKIVLTASTISVDPRQVATLADLRRSLSHGTTDGSSAASIALRPRERQIRFDVIRGSF